MTIPAPIIMSPIQNKVGLYRVIPANHARKPTTLHGPLDKKRH